MKVKRLLPASVMLLALLVAITSSVFAQEPPKDISGHVVNGTAGVEGLEDGEVTLHVFLGGELLYSRTAVPDPEGRFMFQDVPQQVNLLYLLTATYQGVPYTMELTPDSDLSDLRLTVYESAATMEEIAFTGWSLFILAADSGTRTLSALEVVTIVNQGDRAFVPDLTAGEAMAFLRFPLPPGANALQVESELPQGQVLQVERGFAVTTPVPPGEYGIAFTYTIPYNGRELDLSRTFRLGTGTFRLLVYEELGSVSTGGLNNLGTTAIGDTTYRMFGATDVVPDAGISVTLGDLPQPSAWQRLREWLNLRSAAGVAIPGIFTLALAALLVAKLVQRRPVEIGEGPVSIAEDRLSMIRTIAALDDRLQRGELAEEEYRRRRQELKARLLRLVWQEEAS